MARISDYLKPETLRELETAFSGTMGVRVRIGCDESDVRNGAGGDPLCAPVRIDGSRAGFVSVEDAEPGDAAGEPVAAWKGRLAKMLADVIGRMCAHEEQLRTRVGELATLYRLTAEFTGRRDLQETLDLVARTVVDALKAKACTIRLLNAERTELVIQAVAGLSPEYLNKGPILLSESKIDQEVLDAGEPVYIADQRNDPRVLYPREATREGIVSGLCAPMMYRGRPEGVLRVYTACVHEFSWFERSLLTAIAAEAAAAIVNARLRSEAVSLANMRRQLQLAGEVQRRMIPQEAPRPEGFDIGAIYVPTYELSGDFYDFIELPEGNLGLVVCDVVGKGVRASLLTASIRASLRGHAANVYEMAEVVNKVNRDLCADTLASDFATMVYGVLDSRDRRWTYTNAGHLPPMLARDGRITELRGGGAILGVDPDQQYRWESSVLRSGDAILIYTDGLSEAMNFQDDLFGRDRIRQAFHNALKDHGSAQDIARHILWEKRRFTGLQRRFDDLTMVVVEVL